MVDYKEKKWIWITALQTVWQPPNPNEGYTIDAERNFTRLIQASAYHISCYEKNEIPLDGDIYVIVQFDIGNLDKEIEFAKKVKELGKKLIVCYSADLRFLIGNCFISPKGTLYTELSRYADVILSGTGKDVDIYGRFADKVISWGLPMERLDFSTKKYKDKEIDVLISGSQGAESFAFELEFMLMLQERYPEIKIMHSSQEGHREFMNQMKSIYSGIEFVHEPLIKNLVNSKCYINLETRPRGGRAMLDAWMCRTPFISCKSTFYSQIFPDYSYSAELNLTNILENYSNLKYIMNNYYEEFINKAERNAEPFYFDNEIKYLMYRLYPE